MKSRNKVMILGNLGADPEVRWTQSGQAVANISIATSRKWKDKNSGEDREETEWHKVTFWGRMAEIVGEYCAKGDRIDVEGFLRTRKWQDQEGNDRYTTEIVAQDMILLSSQGGSQGGSQGQGQARNQGQAPQAPQGARNAGGPAYRPQGGPPPRQAPAQAPQGNGDFDDDIPF